MPRLAYSALVVLTRNQRQAPPRAYHNGGLEIGQLITPSRYHRTLDGAELARRREMLDLTQEQLAAKAGCSTRYIQQLEGPGEWNNYKHEVGWWPGAETKQIVSACKEKKGE